MTTLRLRANLPRALPALVVALVLSACGPGTSSVGSGRGESERPGRTKTLNIALTTNPNAMSVMSYGTPTGGWGGLHELHSDGLVTTGRTSALIGRLAERVPSVEDGSVSVMPDGRMRVVFTLRKGVTWQDGAPFTAHDLAFTFKPTLDYAQDRSPMLRVMESVEAVDDYTAAFTYQSPHYLGNVLLLQKYWPLPRHILEQPYLDAVAADNPLEFVNHPYWTSEYVHLGAFRLASFDPGTAIQFRAYDGYHQGRPKVDVVNVRVFGSDQSAIAELLAGTLDIFWDYVLREELALQLQARWASDGGGIVRSRPDIARYLYPQMRLEYQKEPGNLDPRVRIALFQAIDRHNLATAATTSTTTQGIWSLLPPGDCLYDATKDGFVRYPYDPERAKVILRDLGWAPAADGVMRNATDGRRFQTQITTTKGNREWEAPVYASFWRQIGLEVEELIIPAALESNAEYRATFSGWEGSSGGFGDSLNRFMGPAAAPPRWAGNRGGYDDPTANALDARYRRSLSERDQFEAMKAISDFFVENLPALPIYFSTEYFGARKGVLALDDVEGSGPNSATQLASASRNAYLWDLQ